MTATSPSALPAQPKEEQIPNADSIIVYEEVMESTPEDANAGDSDERKNNNSSGDSADNQAHNSDDERRQRQALSTSSAEPIVADERVPMLLESPEYDNDVSQ